MGIVVSDTSPLRALHHLGLMALLKDLYGEVCIPPTVRQELESPKAVTPSVIIGHYPFLHERAPRAILAVPAGLDAGEREALILAVELKAEYILMDERAGRLAAQHLGLVTTGVVGVLGRAKALGLVPLVRPLLNELETGLRFHLRADFKNQALADFGE